MIAIGVQCERIASIVRRVLDYARRRPPKRRWVDGADIVGQTHALLRGLARQRDVVLAIEMSAGGVELFADPDQMQQALINIVMNAVHASPPNATVFLRIERVQRPIQGDARDLIVFIVQDEGPGIAQDLVDRIFDPFFTTKPPEKAPASD